MSFGLLTYETTNLGDEVQSIAAQRFLPRVDALLQRDALQREPDGAGPVHAILNGWYLGPPMQWPPHPRIRPLLLSMHFSTRRSRRRIWRAPPAARMLTPQGRAWLTANGPVGARDLATFELLQRHRIPSWHSGCLTLTLPASSAVRDDVVVACDLPPQHVEALRRRTASRVVCVTHHDAVTTGHAQRMATAQALLDLYARARAVVTTRLHCTLPCLAFGTPVLFVPVDPDRRRQQPGFDLAHVAMPAAFLSGRFDFDLKAPPPNPEHWRPLARQLAERCRDFILSAPRPPAVQELAR
ncbi:polysaccharide pyruvyl transferase family protein [Rhizobacter sp. P5_C2]